MHVHGDISTMSKMLLNYDACGHGIGLVDGIGVVLLFHI